MEPVKENEKKNSERGRRQTKSAGAEGQELTRDLATGRPLVSLATAVLVE